MPFVKRKWEQIKGPDYKTKFRVTKNDITLNYTLSRAVRDTYKVEFTIIIVPKALVKPEEQIDREVYKNSLKEAIVYEVVWNCWLSKDQAKGGRQRVFQVSTYKSVFIKVLFL